jgi:hypothetical protein
MNSSLTKSTTIWSAAGGGPGRTGRAFHSGRIGARPARTVTLDAGIRAAVVFDAGARAFVADMGGNVSAFAADGRKLWRQTVDGAVSATPVVDVDAGRLFVGTQAGWVYGLNCVDGAVLWRRRLPSASDPRIVADLLFLPGLERVVTSSWGGEFHAVRAGSGETIHTWNAGISPQAAASADANNNLYCLRAVWDEGIALVRLGPDGSEKVLHRHPEGERRANRMVVAAAPVVDDEHGTLYFVTNGDRSGLVHAWDLAADQPKWCVEFERAIVATPALRSDGILMVADMTGALNVVSSATIHFRYQTGCEYLLAGPICNGSSLTYLGDPIGLLHRVSSEGKGKSIFEARRSIEARPSWNPDGELYLPSMDGRVHIFRAEGDPAEA